VISHVIKEEIIDIKQYLIKYLACAEKPTDEQLNLPYRNQKITKRTKKLSAVKIITVFRDSLEGRRDFMVGKISEMRSFKLAASREHWHLIVDMATLKKSMP